MATVVAFAVTYGSTIAAGAAILGAGSSISAKRQAAKAQRNQAEKQRKIADIRAQRERVQAVRARRRAVAQVQAAELASGVSTSTSSGTIGSIRSQTSSAIGAGQRISLLNEEISIFNQRATSKAASFDAIGDFAGGVVKVNSIFS